jgi:ABC-type transporter Mla MlaB component
MVFSFFKKRPEKMVARPAVRTPAAGGGEAQPSVPEPAKEESVQEDVSLDEFSDMGFTKSSFDFQVDVEADVDPVNAPAEEAAVLFANNQDQEAQAILENAVKFQKTGAAERLWLMLFDLYRLSGQQAAFEAMGIEYARAFEKSPPVWGAEREPAQSAKAPKSGGGSVLFKGNLLGGNVSAFDTVRQALEKNRTLRLDLSKVKQADPEGCASLLELLLLARKEKRGIDLRGRDGLIKLVNDGIEAGKKNTPVTGKECWLLLLELFQQQGRQEVFEELAIDYAVTFEESPPSWDAGRVAPEPAAQEEAVQEDEARDDDMYGLSGEIKSSRFADLPQFVKGRDSLLIDCAKLTRIDFVSAGALLNSLMPVRGAGKQIAFYHPNHLVAELFRIVGLTGIASIVFAKH